MTAALFLFAQGWILSYLIGHRHGQGRRGLRAILDALAFAPAIGLGGASLVFVAAGLAGITPPSGWHLVAFSALPGAGLLLLTRPAAGTAYEKPFSSPPRWLVAALVLLVGASAWMVGRADARNPRGGYDAIAIWQVSARILEGAPTRAGTILRAIPPSHHGDYPGLLPGAFAATWHVEGADSPSAQTFVLALFGLGLLAALWRAVDRVSGPTAACCAVIVLASTPELLIYLHLQYVDPIVAYLLLLALDGFAQELEERPMTSPLLTGFAFGLMPWAKNEGVALAVLLLLVFLGGVAMRRRSEILRRLRPMAAGAFLPLAVHLLFKTLWAPPNDMLRNLHSTWSQLTDASRWRRVARGFGEEWNPLRGFKRWGAAWLILPMALLGTRRERLKRSGTLMAAAFVLLALAAWFGVYLLSYADLDWHIPTSLHRLLLQVYPAALLAAIWWGWPENGDAGAAEEEKEWGAQD